MSMLRMKRGVNAALDRVTGYRLVRGPRRTGATDAQVRGCLIEAFDTSKVSGWVAMAANADPVQVALVVNEQEVTATWATKPMARNGWGEVRSFEFTLRDIWTYCKKRDKLSVRVAGKTLPITGHGMYIAPPHNGQENLAALRAKLAAGHVFGPTGRLKLSKRLDTEWQAKVMHLYGQVRELVRETLGYDVFLAYGSLLGAVREGGVIGHDSDFDSAYVSRYADARAAAELQELAFMLVERGFDIDGMRTSLHIHDVTDRAARIDLFHLYFDESATLQFPFGVAGTTEISASDWQGTKEIDFCGARALMPVNADQFVEHIYGAEWRTPQIGFDWKRDRTKRDMKGFLPASIGEEVYWSNFYMRNEFDSGSTFFEAVDARSDTPTTVLDVGCGDGRDGLAFGKAGRTVLGLDRSVVGVRHASRRAAEMGLHGRVRFATCDVADADAFTEHVTHLTRDTDRPLLFYLRFLLNSLSEQAQDTLMTAICEAARAGDMFAAEFRTNDDKDLKKAFRKHYRRYQDGITFGIALSDRFGFDVIEEVEGMGLSPYLDEDPHVYRVIARRR